jgi:hypothetical protein
MRSPQEIYFRLRQEAANALLARSSPKLQLRAHAPLAILPDPENVAHALRDTDYTRDLIAVADELLDNRIPIFDKVIDYGSEIAWRRDPYRGTETPPTYFRRIPYLDLATAGDHKFIWEVNRHQHLVLLAQTAVLTDDARYSEHVFRQLEHWWSENPFQFGINWTSALEVAFRALSWVWVFHLIGARMSAEFRARFMAELYRHGFHLEYNLSIYFSPNTHLLGEAVALHAIGRVFPQFPRAEEWRELTRRIIEKHMSSRVNEDGSYFEQSTYYHVYALDMFAFHAVLEDVSADYRAKLARMAEFLASIVSDDGELAFLGDDDGGRFFYPHGSRPRFARASLAAVSVLLGKRFFSYDESDLAEIAQWWLGPQRCSIPLPDVPIRANLAVFEDTGIAVFRHGPTYALFDAGPFGPGTAGHSHSDTLSLVVSAGDREVLIDSGTYSYMDAAWRPAFRGSAAHNTIRIDGGDQASSAGPFRWTNPPEVKLLAAIESAEGMRAAAICSYAGFAHKRAVALVAGAFLVTDEVSGLPGEHDIEQFWHFAVEPRQVDTSTWEIDDLATLTVDGGVVEPAWRSRCFGSKEPAWAIVVRRRAALPLVLRAELRVKA